MLQNSNISKFHELRKDYPYFIYEEYIVNIYDSNIEIKYHFNLSGKFRFYPVIEIPLKSLYRNKSIAKEELNNIIFHIGMIELISYWKAACPPKLIIKPHFMNKDQVEWWKKLYFNGLGEFFYVNGINTNQDNFMEIDVDSKEMIGAVSNDLSDDFIIPVGGGKDSAVSLELLSGFDNSSPMVVNPVKASWAIIKNSGFKSEDVIEIKRTLDRQLLELNSKGFLNGHTPFSALLAFISALASIISGKKNIALSNESSANEATIPETRINHQYSKTFEFESDFRYYLRKYICHDINYFSLLRPLNELQIARLLSKIPKNHFDFRSCNRGSKTNTWCGECSKCLFTYIILSPYINQNTLVEIFGKNLFENEKLFDVFNELIGVSPYKPFECIGTVDEVNTALSMYLNKSSDELIPYLLKYYKNQKVFRDYTKRDAGILETQFDTNNFLPDNLQEIINKALCLQRY